MKITTLPKFTLLFLLASLLFFGCSAEDSPEDQIRSFVKSAENAVEEKRIRDLRKMIDDGYSDEGGRNKKELINHIVYHTLRQQSVHLFTAIDIIEISTPTSASVYLFAALTGRPVDSVSILPDIQADIYKFQLHLSKNDNSWQLLSAQWQPASVDDFFQDWNLLYLLRFAHFKKSYSTDTAFLTATHVIIFQIMSRIWYNLRKDNEMTPDIYWYFY